jgi:outer membrane protein assembly factor BamD (BamD/ComL family)
MSYRHLLLLLSVTLGACATSGERGTLAELEGVRIVLKDEKIDDGLEKAMESYRQFLEQTPESAMTPEAIRRIADLSIEKEYGYVADGAVQGAATTTPVMERPQSAAAVAADATATAGAAIAAGKIARADDESEKEFERRMAQGETLPAPPPAGLVVPLPEQNDELDNASAEQAIVLYQKLLKEYPLYERNDQVLYQMSRAYEELGKVEEAMTVMNQFIRTYPTSRYMDEVQFRRAEYYFTRKKFLDAEEAYQAIVAIGAVSSYYELALYKLGWTFYKQDLYEEALQQYFALFDYKLSIGYDFAQTEDKSASQRIEDTYRVISLSFSNMGGPETVTDYFARHGQRSYEDQVYSHLGEYYVTKRRYSDAAASYKAFVGLYAFHEVSPHFNMRIIEIYLKGGFGQLVVEAKKEFAQTYALNADYWHYFDVAARPDVIGFLKSNLKDLANHYHALYQDQRHARDKAANYQEALLWYRSYLSSFPSESESPAINYQMAELMLENRDFGDAAVAYEYTAYNYPLHEHSSAAGYAAVYAYREQLKVVPQSRRGEVKQQIIQSSLKFADTYPEHEKVTIVLGAAADDLYEMKNYELAVTTARKLLDHYPTADKDLVRSAWLVVGHGSFDLKQYAAAEDGYLHVLALTAEQEPTRPKLLDNLAAAIYRQGEQANVLQDYAAAADHFLRVGKLAPQSQIRPTAEYDGAAALIKLQDWARAAEVLTAFRREFPQHELQPEVTKKVAFVYRSAGKLALAAAEYERIERESQDDEVRRGALLIAAELYQEIDDKQNALAVYRRYVGLFPQPVEAALEIYDKMATVNLQLEDRKGYLAILEKMVAVDSAAGAGRTDRTRYLAAQAALLLTEPLYDSFLAVELVQPLKENLLKKKSQMKAAINGYTRLLDYETADVTAAATYYMAEIYYHFSKALMSSPRPDNLSELELEQYELAIEEQSYPFEEKAIGVHKKNLELLHGGLHSAWIDKSIGKLALLFPANYARPEQSTGFITTIDAYRFQLKRPEAAVSASEQAAPVPGAQTSQAEEATAATSPLEESQTAAPLSQTVTIEALSVAQEPGGEGLNAPEPVSEQSQQSTSAEPVDETPRPDAAESVPQLPSASATEGPATVAEPLLP